MSFPFTPINKSGILTVAADSTDYSLEVTGANAVLISNPDVSTAIVVAFGFEGDGELDAVFPDNDSNGVGTVVPPYSTQLFKLPQAAYSSTMWMSLASASGASTNVYYSLGTI